MVQMADSSNSKGQGASGGDDRKPYRGSRPDLQEKIKQKILRKLNSRASTSSSGQNSSPGIKPDYSQNGGASNNRQYLHGQRPERVSYNSTPEMAFNDPDGNGNLMFFDGSPFNPSPSYLGVSGGQVGATGGQLGFAGGQGQDKEDSVLNTVLKEIQHKGTKTTQTNVIEDEEGTVYQNNFDDEPEEIIPDVARQQPDYSLPVVARLDSNYALPVFDRQQSGHAIPAVARQQSGRAIPAVAKQQPDYTLPVVARQQPDHAVLSVARQQHNERSQHRPHRHHVRTAIQSVRQPDEEGDGDDENTDTDDPMTLRRSRSQGQDIDPLQSIINACNDEVNGQIDDSLFGMRPEVPGRGYEFPIRREAAGDLFRGQGEGHDPLDHILKDLEHRNEIFDVNADDFIRNDGHNAEMMTLKRQNQLLGQRLNEREAGLREGDNSSPYNDSMGAPFLERDQVHQDEDGNGKNVENVASEQREERPGNSFVDELLAGLNDDEDRQPDDNLVYRTLTDLGESAEESERFVNQMRNDHRELLGGDMGAGSVDISPFPPNGEEVLSSNTNNPLEPPDNVNTRTNSHALGVDLPNDEPHKVDEMKPNQKDRNLVGASSKQNESGEMQGLGFPLRTDSLLDSNPRASARNDSSEHALWSSHTQRQPPSCNETQLQSACAGQSDFDHSSTGHGLTDFGHLSAGHYQAEFGQHSTGSGKTRFDQHSTGSGQHSTGSGQTGFGLHSTGPDQDGFGQHSTGHGQAGFGQHSLGSGQTGFVQHSLGSGQTGFGQHSLGSGQTGFGQHLTEPGQTGFGQHLTEPGQTGFGQHLTEPGQTGFGQYSTGSNQTGFGQYSTGSNQTGFGQYSSGLGQTGFGQYSTGHGQADFSQYSTGASQSGYGHLSSGHIDGQYDDESNDTLNVEQPDTKDVLSQMINYESIKGKKLYLLHG